MSVSWSSSHQYAPVKERESSLSLFLPPSFPPSLNPGTLTLYAQPSAALWSQLQHPSGLLTTQQWIMHEHEAAVFATERERESSPPLCEVRQTAEGNECENMDLRWEREKERKGRRRRAAWEQDERGFNSVAEPSFLSHTSPSHRSFAFPPSEDFCRGSLWLQMEPRN